MGRGSLEAQASAVSQCVSDIEVADFVALDFEFSGLFLNPEREKRILSLDDYYEKCSESVPEFLALQMGVCCARKSKDGSGAWELRTHEFNLWPQDRRIFNLDLQSLRFLSTHGFDFNAFFAQAHNYRRLPTLDADKGNPTAKLPASHASTVVAALRRCRVPLVFHNAMLDLLHMQDKFFGNLPDERKEFAEAWTENFPLLFDTRLLAQEGKFKVLKYAGSINLEDLHKHLVALPDMAVRFVHQGPLGTDRSAHGSAGHDARLTAEVFTMAMDAWLRADAAGVGKKRRTAAAMAEVAEPNGISAQGVSDTSATTNDDGGGWTVVGSKRKVAAAGLVPEQGAAAGLTSADLLESHEVCRRFHNRIAIVGALPDSWDLGRPVGLKMDAAAPEGKVLTASVTATDAKDPSTGGGIVGIGDESLIINGQ